MNILHNFLKVYNDTFKTKVIDEFKDKSDLRYYDLVRLYSAYNLSYKLEELINLDKNFFYKHSLSQFEKYLNYIKDDFKNINIENREDKIFKLVKYYSDWYRNTYNRCDMKFTPNLKVYKFIDMLYLTNKSTNIIEDLYKGGIYSLSWEICRLELNTLNIIESSIIS